jgi:hypothetical protein
MSTVTSNLRYALWGGALALLVALGAQASDDPPKQCADPVLGIIEGPDPVSGRCRTGTTTLYARIGVDAPGRSARDARTGRQIHVWAAPVAVDHDIVLTERDASGAEHTTYLTSALTDDLDPRLALDAAGGLHVVWWSRGDQDQIVYAERDMRSGGWYPDRVVAIDGRSPALAVEGGAAWFAFVREGKGGSEIVLVEPTDSGAMLSSIAARTLDRGVSELSLALVSGRPTIGWTESSGRVVRAERWGSTWVRHDVGSRGR